MVNARHVRESGITLAIAAAFVWMLVAMLGLPPLGAALALWSGGFPTEKGAVDTVVSIIWVLVMLVTVIAAISVAVSTTDYVRAVRLEHRRDVALGVAGFAILCICLITTHQTGLHAGSIHDAMSLVAAPHKG